MERDGEEMDGKKSNINMLDDGCCEKPLERNKRDTCEG